MNFSQWCVVGSWMGLDGWFLCEWWGREGGMRECFVFWGLGELGARVFWVLRDFSSSFVCMAGCVGISGAFRWRVEGLLAKLGVVCWGVSQLEKVSWEINFIVTL